MRPNTQARDLVVLAPNIHTFADPGRAEALLVRDGLIAAAGTRGEIAVAARSAERLDLAGATLTPGLIDSHIHLTEWAFARLRAELYTATPEQALQRIGVAQPEAGWLRGGGWDANRWGRFPTRQELDSVTGSRPAVFDSHDLHSMWVNSAALERCGIDRSVADPPGGRLLRDADGEPTGVLLEDARQLVTRALPQPEGEEVQRALVAAQAALHALGLTGVHSVEPEGLGDLEMLRQAERLTMRVLQHLPLQHLDAAAELGLRSGWHSPSSSAAAPGVRIGGVKMFLDGALGSRTALLRDPYNGTAGDRGVSTLPPDEFREHVRTAASAGLASTVHAIGDAAVELALEVLGSIAPPAAVPHRIEHLQLCPPDLWELAARSGITASMQPVHLLTDIPAAEQHWGHERSRGAYPFAPLLKRGMLLAFGSDAPVESPDPRLGLFAAARRVTWNGSYEGAEWYPEHKLSVRQALEAYTAAPAAAGGEGAVRGRLSPGMQADLVAWDRDPLACEPDELREIKCVLVMVGGKVVYRQSDT